MDLNRKYSQNNQQQIIMAHFSGRVPQVKFLDIGAFNGVQLSNVYKLIISGCKGGVSVQPSPTVLPILRNNYKDFSNVRIVQKAIASSAGQIKWFDSNGDAVGSTDVAHVDKWTAGSQVKFTQTTVQAITMQDLFDDVGYDFNFISLDIQGKNIDMFRRIDFSKFTNLTLFCVQHDNNQKQMTSTMHNHGFEVVLHNAQNLIFEKKR